MNENKKELLLRDLCGRLPYGVKIDITWRCMGEGFSIDTTLEPEHIDKFLNDSEGEIEIKPYLRPMSSMTEEEEDIFLNKEGHDIYDWLNKKMFDYRKLIARGMANVAPEGMY